MGGRVFLSILAALYWGASVGAPEVDSQEQSAVHTTGTYAAHAEHACRQLVDLAKNGCDKFDEGHAYQNMYCDLFFPLRSQHIRMLEIGLGCGHYHPGLSAVVWKNWFHSLDYYAIDYIPENDSKMNTCWGDFNKTHPNVVKHLWIGDQGDKIFLGKVVSEFAAMQPPGPALFDVIIDDGAHVYDFIKASFQFLWPHVAPGGGLRCGGHGGGL